MCFFWNNEIILSTWLVCYLLHNWFVWYFFSGLCYISIVHFIPDLGKLCICSCIITTIRVVNSLMCMEFVFVCVCFLYSTFMMWFSWFLVLRCCYLVINLNKELVFMYVARTLQKCGCICVGFSNNTLLLENPTLTWHFLRVRAI